MKYKALVGGVLGIVILLVQYLGFTQTIEQLITTVAAIAIAVLAFWIFSELREKEHDVSEAPAEHLDPPVQQ